MFKDFFRNKIKHIVPFPIRATLKSHKILSRDFGQFKSMRRWESIDAQGNPIPWYTYPAVEFLKQLDLSDRAIFEFGSGNSTRFFAARCRQVVAVEDDLDWYEKIKGQLPGNVEYLFRREQQAYINAIHEQEADFDVIVIDGRHYRYECGAEALKKLRPDGFIILDNADWHEKTSQMLREADLIEVDMAGFGPINGYTSTTSFYFTRGVQLKPAGERQPLPGIGAKLICEDERANGVIN
ncbi:MAG: SAM-dependent methyltransferase [Anaerolineae bacterium]|nr:SAM-dependent methyltransferase [Anaerolineae bacterium]